MHEIPFQVVVFKYNFYYKILIENIYNMCNLIDVIV